MCDELYSVSVYHFNIDVSFAFTTHDVLPSPTRIVYIFSTYIFMFFEPFFFERMWNVFCRQTMYIPSSFIYGTFSTLNNSVESECLIFSFSFFIFCILARIVLFHVFFSMYNHEPNVRVFTKFFFIKNNMYYFFLCLHQSHENNEKLRRIWFFILSHSKLFPSLHRIFVHLVFLTAFLYLLNDQLLNHLFHFWYNISNCASINIFCC